MHFKLVLKVGFLVLMIFLEQEQDGTYMES